MSIIRERSLRASPIVHERNPPLTHALTLGSLQDFEIILSTTGDLIAVLLSSQTFLHDFWAEYVYRLLRGNEVR